MLTLEEKKFSPDFQFEALIEVYLIVYFIKLIGATN